MMEKRSGWTQKVCDQEAPAGFEDTVNFSQAAYFQILWQVMHHQTGGDYAPEAPYEISGGFRNNVIFPGGMIIEDIGEVKMYYGAADTVQCLATAQLDELIDFCLSFK